MRKTFFALTAVALLAGACSRKSGGGVKLKADTDSVAYIIGMNVGMNLRVLPVIGVTLPFFSAGGSSVVMMYLCVGIVLSVGMNTRRSKLEMQQIL